MVRMHLEHRKITRSAEVVTKVAGLLKPKGHLMSSLLERRCPAISSGLQECFFT
jgi:2-polyprenyl-3-methyl-5-hydroxy-6-metoxy-1,4-benzoquinol methylase